MINKTEQYKRLREAGVSPGAWQAFIRALGREALPIHAALLATPEKVLAEVYTDEVGPETLHRTYSLSKSVTAFAIGLLEAEGKLSLDDRLISYYPEYEAEAEPWLRQLTLRQMLRMETCHSTTTYKLDVTKPWVESFFKVKPDHAPGTVFIYDTSSSHVLAHLAERLTGQKILDYLRDKGLRAKGLSDAAYFLNDPQGSPIGGSGFMATLRDCALFGRLVLAGGGGIFPEDFCRDMTAPLTQTALEASLPEEGYGYGYQTWRHRAGWCFFGMGGQLVIALPEKNLLLAVFADLRKSKALVQRLYDLFFDCLEESREKTDEIPALSLPLAAGGAYGTGPKLRLEGAIPGGKVTFSHDGEGEGLLVLERDGYTLRLPFTRGRQRETLIEAPEDTWKAYVSAAWLGGRQLYLLAQVIDREVGSLEVQLGLGDGVMTISIGNNVERYTVKWRGLWTSETKEA